MQRKINHATDSRVDDTITVADVCHVCKRRVGSQCKRCGLFLCAACAEGPEHFCNAQREWKAKKILGQVAFLAVTHFLSRGLKHRRGGVARRRDSTPSTCVWRITDFRHKSVIRQTHGKGNLRLTAGPPVHGLQTGQAGQDSELPNRKRLAIPQGRDNALDGWTVYGRPSVRKGDLVSPSGRKNGAGPA